MKHAILIAVVAVVLALSGFASAAWAVDQKAMNDCLCECGCGVSWYCSEVACYYHPGAVDASPDCLDTGLGECVCQGFGCGREPIASSGSCYDGCQERYGEPKKNDGVCDIYKGENCTDSSLSECKCATGRYCNPSDDYADGYGCAEDYCANKKCEDYCGGSTMYTGGKCDQGDYGDCGYKTTDCKLGCDSSGKKCEPSSCNRDGACDSTEDETCSDCVEKCDDQKDNDGNGDTDCADEQCASDPVCKQNVKIKVIDGVYGQPMKNITVTLFASDSYSQETVGTNYTDKDGIAGFTIDMTAFSDPPVQAYAQIDYKEAEGVFEIIYDEGGANKATSVYSADFKVPWGASPFVVTMKPASGSIDSSKTDSGTLNRIKDLSLIYHYTSEVADFYRVNLSYEYDASKLPVKIYTFSTQGSCQACYRPSNHNIYMDVNTSLIRDKSKPENREWHEFSHHVMNDLYGAFPARTANEKNHDGFNNEFTTDSWTESFAEFWPSVLGGDNEYGNFYYLYDNTRAWDSFGTREELAFLSTMWSVKKDVMDGSYKDMWDFMITNTPNNIQEFYDALITEYPSDKKTIDAIWVSHGFFKDTDVGNGQWDPKERCIDANSNKKCDYGESASIDYGMPNETKPNLKAYQKYDNKTDTVGTASNYERPDRTRRPFFWFDSVKLTAADGSGNPVDDAAFLVTFEYSGTCEGQTFSTTGQSTGGGLNILFPHDLGTCKIEAHITPENYQKAEELVLTEDDLYSGAFLTGNSDIWAPGYAAERTIKVGNKQDFCNNNGNCDYGEPESCADCAVNMQEYECRLDSDCNKGTCEGGACKGGTPVAPQPEIKCASDANCLDGYSCSGGSCQKKEDGCLGSAAFLLLTGALAFYARKK